MTTPITIISFGFLHGVAPDAEHVEDVRDTLRDPAGAKDILDLDGRDERVRRVVLTTPGAVPLVFELAAYVMTLPTDQPRRIAIGCAGGRHRSAVLAEAVAEVLRAIRQSVIVEHRDIHFPRVLTGGEPR